MFSGRQTASLERNAKVNFTRETLGHETNKHNENARIEKSDLFLHFIYTYSSKLHVINWILKRNDAVLSERPFHINLEWKLEKSAAECYPDFAQEEYF